jgi:hypothetical protein
LLPSTTVINHRSYVAALPYDMCLDVAADLERIIYPRSGDFSSRSRSRRTQSKSQINLGWN